MKTELFNGIHEGLKTAVENRYEYLELFKVVKSKDKEKRAKGALAIALTKDGKDVHFAKVLVHPRDQYSKKVARQKLLSRLVHGDHDLVTGTEMDWKEIETVLFKSFRDIDQELFHKNFQNSIKFLEFKLSELK
jgi:hypothetical protein